MNWKRQETGFIIHGIFVMLFLCILLISGLKGCAFLLIDKQANIETKQSSNPYGAAE